jgi:RecB family exonuclease
MRHPPLLDAGAPEELARAVAHARDGDPPAPVTVVAPSEHAALFVRRSLGAGSGPGDGPAAVGCTTVAGLIRTLGLPALAERGLRPASSAVDLEAIRAEASRCDGWIGQRAGYPGAEVELRRALDELRRRPAVGPAGAGLVPLLHAVRRRLHRGGFADVGDLTAHALDAARRGDPAAQALGRLVWWHLGPLAPAEREILDRLTPRSPPAERGCGSVPVFTEVRTYADPDDEARGAVGSVIVAAEQGVPLWRQAILHPPGPTAVRVLRQHLADAGVATHGPGSSPLARSTTGRALLELLDLAAGDWPRHQVMAWLSAAPVTIPGGELVPVSRWDAVSAAAGVVRGPRQWHDRLARLSRGTDADAAEAAALAAFVSDLMARCAAPGPSWASFAAWAHDLLDLYLPCPGSAGWPPSEEAAAAGVRAIVSDLRDLDRISATVDLAAFRRAVRVQLDSTMPETGEGGEGGFGDGVFVAPYGGARGLLFDSVVVTGLADALVSGPAGDNDTVLRDDLCQALASGSDHRTGSLPRADPRTGRAHVPWRWMRDLVGPDTPWRHVDASAAGLAAGQPATTVREYELRQLERWVRAGGDPALSPVAADPRLARGFEAARARADTRFTRFDGYVGPGLVSCFDAQEPVSATRLETYATCPRRYLFDRVLRVSPRVLPERLWRIEAVTRGSLVHRILEEYVKERLGGAPRSLARLLDLAGARLDDVEHGGLVGKPLLWRMERAAILQDLRRFHDEEGDNEPLAAELSFGHDEEDAGPPVTVVLDDGRTLSFRGSADRVDRTASGHLMVSDYKTGRQSSLQGLTKDPVARGRLLQLPLYAMAARTRFEGPAPVHARYWLLSGDRSAPCYHLVVTPEVETRFRHVVRLIADGVDDGCFPGVPGATWNDSARNCAGCDFDHACPAARGRQWGRTRNAAQLRGLVSLLDDDAPDTLAGAVVKGFVDPDDGVGG